MTFIAWCNFPCQQKSQECLPAWSEPWVSPVRKWVLGLTCSEVSRMVAFTELPAQLQTRRQASTPWDFLEVTPDVAASLIGSLSVYFWEVSKWNLTASLTSSPSFCFFPGNRGQEALWHLQGLWWLFGSSWFMATGRETRESGVVSENRMLSFEPVETTMLCVWVLWHPFRAELLQKLTASKVLLTLKLFSFLWWCWVWNPETWSC